MRTTAYRTFAIALLLVLAASFGLQRAARAGDAGAVLGGILAGAIVYEMLDDDNYCHSHYYYHSPGYYPPPVYRSYGYTYYDYGPPVVVYRPYDYRPRTYGYYRYDGYYDGPRTSYQARRAPSHAQRNVGPPPGYGRGGKYSPPRYYK
ncbi:MAG: hypothetical protein FJX75_00605 [Armatimonadetes bacterium]|nr:hypothetical protein [Armatimonadota bacterium]